MPAFFAGYLNEIVKSDEFKYLRRKNYCPQLRKKIEVANELLHGITRSNNFEGTKEYFYGCLAELETGEASWTDDEYWNDTMAGYRGFLKPSQGNDDEGFQPRHQAQGSGNQAYSSKVSRTFCENFNNETCSQDTHHTENGAKMWHLCKVCVNREPATLSEDHGAKSCPRKMDFNRPQNRGRGRRNSSRGGGRY